MEHPDINCTWNFFSLSLHMVKGVRWIRIYTKEYYSAKYRNTFESDLMRWKKLDPGIV